MLRRIIAQVRTALVGITTAQRETTIPTPAKRDTQAPTNLGGKLNILKSMTDNYLQKQLEYFKANQKELVKKYEGKFLVIKDQQVQGVYDTEIEAYTEAKKKFDLGTFLIQQCLPGQESYTQTFHSRVALS